MEIVIRFWHFKLCWNLSNLSLSWLFLSLGTFCEINYTVEVYLNGLKKVIPKGMLQRHSLDVTDIQHPDGQNLLVVLVHPPNHPARIPPKGVKVVTTRFMTKSKPVQFIYYFVLGFTFMILEFHASGMME